MSIIEKTVAGRADRAVLYPAALLVPEWLYPRHGWCDFPVPFEPGEEFVFSPRAKARRLVFRPVLPTGARGRIALEILRGSQIGREGEVLRLEQGLSFLDPYGRPIDAALLYFPPANAHARGIELILPLAPFRPGAPHVLERIDPPDGVFARMETTAGHLLPHGFRRGSRIRRADRALVPVERLTPGMALAGADGAPVRLLDMRRRTLPALGEAAPILLPRGTLSNRDDLTLSPWHRVRLRDWRIRGKEGRGDVLARLADLAEAGIGTRLEGGVAEYFALVTDRPALIEVEGLPVEAMPGEGPLAVREDTRFEKMHTLSAQELRSYAHLVAPAARQG